MNANIEALSEALFEQAVGYARQGDGEALQKLMDTGKVGTTREGACVFVEDMGVFNGMATVRVPGMTGLAYVDLDALSCD